MELDYLLTKLRMDHLETQIDAVCEQEAAKQMDYKAFLTQALITEWQVRYQLGIEACLKQACFLWIKTLNQFEFEFQPSMDFEINRPGVLRFTPKAYRRVRNSSISEKFQPPTSGFTSVFLWETKNQSPTDSGS
jgi:hypothetical protein